MVDIDMWSIFKRSRSNKNVTSEDYHSYIDNDVYRQFKVNVAGITKDNADGSSRAGVAFSCRYGQRLLLVREPDNRYDKNAVIIVTENGEQLGYLDASNARELQSTLKGTSKTYSHIEAAFLESGMHETVEKDILPYCTISLRRFNRSKNIDNGPASAL